jgi:hypothetical protein
LKIRVVVDGVLHEFGAKGEIRAINNEADLLIIRDYTNPSDVEDLAVFRKWDYWERFD